MNWPEIERRRKRRVRLGITALVLAISSPIWITVIRDAYQIYKGDQWIEIRIPRLGIDWTIGDDMYGGGFVGRDGLPLAAYIPGDDFVGATGVEEMSAEGVRHAERIDGFYVGDFLVELHALIARDCTDSELLDAFARCEGLAEFTGSPVGSWLHDPRLQTREGTVRELVDRYGWDPHHEVDGESCWAYWGIRAICLEREIDGSWEYRSFSYSTPSRRNRDRLASSALRWENDAHGNIRPVDVAVSYGNTKYVRLMREEGWLDSYPDEEIERLAQKAESLEHDLVSMVLRGAKESD